MSTAEIMRELELLPEVFLDEVFDFVQFLKTRAAHQRLETALASEPVLAKDWLRPEEDAAWEDL
ncbi:MAG TPA: DUF2281 domain-containing protein [Phycisphaerae bacterium]|jgi:hypothetical protein